MGTTTQKLEYLGTTKSQLKDQINYGLPTEKQITNQTTFREYVGSIFEAFLEALRNPDTLFNNLPKTSASGSQMTLNGTANAPMRITLNPTAISQDGTPTPSSPQDIHTISGNNSVVVDNGNGLSQTNPINLGEYELGTIGNYSNEFVRSDGEQLFDISQNPIIAKVAYNGSGALVTWAGYVGINTYIPIEANTTYTISSSLNINLDRVVYYDSGKNILSNTANVSTFTTPNNCAYIRFCYYIANETIPTWVMLNKGTTALPYVPYEKGWYYKQGIGKVVLDGSETGLTKTTDTATSNFAITLQNDTALKSSNGKGKSNYFVYGYNNSVGKFYFNNLTPASLVMCMENTYTLDTFKTWLSTHNTTIYYPLATPTYTKITGELANQLEQVYKGMLSYDGTTNISQVNNDLAFELVASAITK